jgi:addiction module HigA family antidote
MTNPIDNLPPIHPRHILRDELEALELSARKFAAHIRVPHNAVSGILNGERSISARMAIRLGQAFGTTPQYWLNLQMIYDLKRARAEMPDEVLGIKAVVTGEALIAAMQASPHRGVDIEPRRGRLPVRGVSQ